jgi:hypothetical protein
MNTDKYKTECKRLIPADNGQSFGYTELFCLPENDQSLGPSSTKNRVDDMKAKHQLSASHNTGG